MRLDLFPVDRLRLAKESHFMKRHLPLSDGLDDKHFAGEYQFDWDKHARVVQTKKKCNTSSASTPVVSKESERPMIYDVEKEYMV